MDQKEIEEKLKNFQVKHIEKPEKKEEQPLSDHEGFCEQWKHARRKSSLESEKWKKSKREDICEAYDLLAKCLEGRDYCIVTTNTDAEIFRSRLDAQPGSQRLAAMRPGGSVPVPAPRTSGSRERFRTISAHIAAHRCVAIPLTRILISKKDICLSGWHIPDG